MYYCWWWQYSICCPSSLSSSLIKVSSVAGAALPPPPLAARSVLPTRCPQRSQERIANALSQRSQERIANALPPAQPGAYCQRAALSAARSVLPPVLPQVQPGAYSPPFCPQRSANCPYRIFLVLLLLLPFSVSCKKRNNVNEVPLNFKGIAENKYNKLTTTTVYTCDGRLKTKLLFI